MWYFAYQHNEHGYELEQYFNDKGYPDFNLNYDIIEQIPKRDLEKSNETITNFIGIIKQANQKVFITQFKLKNNMEFHYEKHFLLKLDNQNIIRMIDHQIDGSYGYIIKPYGITLMNILNIISLDQKCWLLIIKGLLKAIDYLQKLNITHNNIAPQNIIFRVSDIDEFISSKNHLDELLRLTNFASARERKFDNDLDFISTFEPPEFINNKIISKSYDVYSLCHMIYYSITGSHPSIESHNFLREPKWLQYPIVKRILEKVLKNEIDHRPLAADLLRIYFNKNKCVTKINHALTYY